MPGRSSPAAQLRRYAAAPRPESENDHSSSAGHIDDRRRLRFGNRSARTGGLDVGAVQDVQCVEQTAVPPIQHMVVGQHAAIDLGSGDTGNILRTHAIVDTLGDEAITPCDCRFQIDDADMRTPTFEFAKGVAPDIRKINWLLDRTMQPLGERHVLRGGLDVRLVNLWVAWEWQDLIDAPARHDIAAQEDRDRVSLTGPIGMGRTQGG